MRRFWVAAIFVAVAIATPFSVSAQVGPPPPPPDGPVISVADVTAFTQDPSGTSVTFAPTAYDNVLAESPAVICEPASGSLFPVTITTVDCSATNSAATTTYKSFTVSVILDTTPPVITTPGDQAFNATSVPATPPLVEATATDDLDSSPIVTHAPSTFSAGTTEVIWTATDAAGNTSTATSSVTITIPDTVQIALRDGSTLIGPFTVELPSDEASDYMLAPTGSSTAYAIPAQSALALLSSLDSSQDSFELTDVSYSNAFSSFLVNCISVPAASASPDCYNWTFAVNGSFPMLGMDHYTLNPGDVMYVFFGTPWNISTDKSAVTTDESFTATAQKYDAATGTYIAAEGYVVGAVQFDNFFTATEFATSTADAGGNAILTLSATGTYAIGIYEAGYFPNVSVTVSAASAPPSGGGGGGGISHATFNVPAALAYLSSKQNPNGSLDVDFVTDWVAIAFAAADPGEAKTKLRSYLLSATPTMSSVLDYERHAMALMALGISPFNGTSVDYISPIVAAFDGTQIGSASLENDDIFALLPLLKAGYSTSDDIIQKSVAFIISRQAANGSWTGGVDITAAAIQALTPAKSLGGVTEALTKAEGYLRSQQQPNGGFSNAPATSWTMQAIGALGQSEHQWAPGGYYPTDYLATFQQPDGGVETTSASLQTRIWSTAYAIPGALKQPWYALLSSFTRPASATGGGGSSTSATTTAATSTAPVATSTLAIATTTEPIMEATTTPLVLADTISPSETSAPLAQRAVPPPQEESVEEVAIDESTTTAAAPTQVAAVAAVAPGFSWWWLILILLALLALAAYMSRRTRREKGQSED